MVGFTSGNGCFISRLRVNDSNAGGRVELIFVLTCKRYHSYEMHKGFLWLWRGILSETAC